MANWSNPTLTSLYTDFVTEVKNRDVDLALGLDPATTSPTNVPTNAIRWNSANSRWEKYTSGSWGTLTATYALTSLSLTGSITFEGATDDAFETTLTVADPTADRTITLPNVSGTVVTTGDTGSITSTMIADGTIVNADVNASAAIAGTKISPDFGSQNVTTTGTSTAAGFIPSSATVPSNGLYLPAANQLGFSTASTASRLTIDGSGNVNIDSGTFYVDAVNNRVGVGTTGPSNPLHVVGTARFNVSGSNNVVFGADSGDPYIYAEQNTALKFGTNSTLRATLDASGNLGLGVVPSTRSVGKALEVAYAGCSLFSSSATQTLLTANATYNSNWLYATANPAAYYQQNNGIHSWHTSTNTPSVGAAITFTQAMTLDASGNLGLGTTALNSYANTTTFTIGNSVNSARIDFKSGSTTTAYVSSDSNAGLYFGASGAERAKFDSSGNLKIAWNNGILAGFYFDATYYQGITNGATTRELFIDCRSNDTRADIVFRTGLNAGVTERARIDSSGRLLVGTASDSGGALLQVNGDRIRVATAKTPASATAAGTAGEVCWDASYIYVCTATDTWKRAAIATW